MFHCDLIFNEKKEIFKIVCTGLNNDFYVIDMNKNELAYSTTSLSNNGCLAQFLLIKNLNYDVSESPHAIVINYD